jgi:hypothetical protein
MEGFDVVGLDSGQILPVAVRQRLRAAEQAFDRKKWSQTYINAFNEERRRYWQQVRAEKKLSDSTKPTAAEVDQYLAEETSLLPVAEEEEENYLVCDVVPPDANINVQPIPGEDEQEPGQSSQEADVETTDFDLWRMFSEWQDFKDICGVKASEAVEMHNGTDMGAYDPMLFFFIEARSMFLVGQDMNISKGKMDWREADTSGQISVSKVWAAKKSAFNEILKAITSSLPADMIYEFTKPETVTGATKTVHVAEPSNKEAKEEFEALFYPKSPVY